MPSDDYLLSILATFKDSASPELKKLGQAITGVEKTTKAAEPRTRSLGSAITAISGQFLVATQAAGQVVAAVKQFYEFGKAGAIIEQTEQSFDGLIDKLGVTPDLLDDLRDASSGTITDMRLMSATTTLLAGAQGDLARELAGATPELLEIAKAANKLNPSLGDTAFLYESLATGIKRASPMILDNLGLTIKIGEANEKYAESIGKTVEQLTAEEQKLALLAETRRAGKVLIEQAGGAADSATDDFARLETEIENVSNAFKKELAPAAGTAAKALIHLTGVVGKTKLDLEIDRIERSNLRYKDKVIAVNALVAEYNWLVDAQGRVVQGYWEENEAGEQVLRTTDNVALSSRILTKAQVAAATEQGKALQALVRSRGDVTDATDYQSEAEWRAAQAARDEADALAALTEQMQEYGPWAQQAARDTWLLANAEEIAETKARELSDAFAELAIQMRGAVGEEQEDYIESTAKAEEKVEGLRQKIADLKAEPSFPTEEQQEQLADYRDEIDEEVATLDELAVAHREAMNSIVFDLVMTRIAQEDWGTEGLELATTLAESMGLIDDETAVMMRGVNASLDTFDRSGNIAAARRELQWLAGDFTAAGAAAEVAGSDMARQRIGERFMEEGVAPVSAFDEMKTEIEDLVEPDYELRFVIPDRDLIIESVATLESMTRFLSGRHTVMFNIQTRGSFPGSAEDIGGGGGGGGPPAARGGRPGAGGGPPRFQFGGLVESSGLAFVEAGELIIPPMEAQQMQQGGGLPSVTYGDTNEFNLNVTSVQETASIIQEFEVMRAMVG